MLEWMRRLPHPGYGKCGGYRRNCALPDSKMPIDKLDQLFQRHDQDLLKAREITDPVLRKEAIKEADLNFGTALRGDVGTLSLFGKVYLFFAKLIFPGRSS